MLVFGGGADRRKFLVPLTAGELLLIPSRNRVVESTPVLLLLLILLAPPLREVVNEKPPLVVLLLLVLPLWEALWFDVGIFMGLGWLYMSH